MRLRVPHVFTLLVYVVVACALLTWIVPSGAFERAQVTLENGMTRQVVVPGSYAAVPKAYSLQAATIGDDVPGAATPVGLLRLLSAIPRGLEASADIVFFIFLVGGVFGILQQTGVVGGTIDLLTRRFGHAGPMLVVVLVVLIGAGGSTVGMGEELIPLVPVFVLMARELGYDRLFGLAIVNLASMVGFAAATTNPFTVAVAQSIAEVPLYSGLGFRAVFFAVAMVLVITHLLRYAARVKSDPSASLVFDLPTRHATVVDPVPYRARHGVILLACAAIFGGVLYGVQTLGWWMPELGAGFLAMGVAAAAIGRLSPDDTARAAVDGMRDMVVAALVVGFARAIVVVLEDGLVLDTVVHTASSALQGLPPVVGAEGMLLFQTLLNVIIPSGSGQAAVTMPVMAPLADLLGVSRQAAVFAFQCGDGMSNMVIPTSGTLMAMLVMADVPYGRWLRFVAPLFVQLMLLSAVFLAFAVMGGLD